MTFLNPFVLFGLIASGIPILIHLLQLKKLRTVGFSSIKFLKEIQHASVRRVKLRDYLLLLLRSLAIASLVVAFARPALKGIGRGDSKGAAVVILDDSPSTSARNEYGEIFSQLKSTALNLINRFNVGDNVDLVFMSHLTRSHRDDRIFSSINPRSLLPLISRADPSNVRVAYEPAIEAAVNSLRSSNYADKEIYLLGDLQRTEFETQKENKNINIFLSGRGNTMLFFLQTNEALDDNLSISNVKLSDPVVEVNASSEVEATVANNGGAEKKGIVVSLYLDGRKAAQGIVDLPAGSSRSVRLAFSVQDGGFHKGIIELGDNSIQRDNKYYFSFYAIKELNIVIVTSKRENDFVLSAVNSVMDTSTSIFTRIVTPDQLAYTDLSGTDVIVMEGYSANRNFEGKLIQFVRGGGGILLFSPRSSQINFFDELLGAINVGRALSFFSSSGGNFLNIERIDAGDDFFSVLFSSKESADQIKSRMVTRISNMARIDPNPFSHVLMSTASGPFLIGREVGRGFVFVVASPADSSSSNFPMSPFFPVVVQRAMFYSAAVKYKPIQIYAGEEADYAYSLGGISSATLIAPDEGKSEVVPNYVGGTAKFLLNGFDAPGIYSLASGSTLCEVSVNVDPRESDLSKASRAEVSDFAKRLGFDERNVFLLNADKNSAANIDRLYRGRDLSSFFAGTALMFLLLEIFVSRMRTVPSAGR